MTITPDRAGLSQHATLGGKAAVPVYYGRQPNRKAHDADQRKVAGSLNARYPGWLILWAPYRRCYTAIAACLPEALIIDERDPLALITLMDMAQLGSASSAAGTRVWPDVQRSPIPYPTASRG